MGRWARESLQAITIVALVFGGLHFWNLQKQRSGSGRVAPGTESVRSTLPNMHSGEDVGIGMFEGRPAIIKFWATWCPHCRDELGRLANLHKTSGERFHLVTVMREAPEVVLPFLKQRQTTLPVLWDQYGAWSSYYRVSSLPTTVILDQRGRVVHDYVGPSDIEILLEHVDVLNSR